MFAALLIGAFALLLILDYLLKKRRDDMFKANGLKEPKSLPLLGCALEWINMTPENIFGKLDEYTRQFGKTWYLWMFHECGIVTSDAKMLEAVYSSQQVISKNNMYRMLDFWLGEGLLLSTGAKWHSRRKVITPTFHFKILEQFVEVFDQQSNVMVEKLRPLADGVTEVNIFPHICAAALDIIAESAMGVKVNAQSQPDFPYVKAVRTVSSIISERTMKPSYRFDIVMRLVAPKAYNDLQHGIEYMHEFTEKVIAERRAALEARIKAGTFESGTNEEDTAVGSKKRMAFLDMLLQSTVKGQPLTDADIREEVDTFMFEGHDTTTSGISFALYMLSLHPEVQAKAFQEIRQVIGDDKSKPVPYRDLQELKYLESVIKETIRLFPPVPLIGRQVEQDIVLNGIKIPANSQITLNTFQAQRDPDYFPEPEKFKPERFSADAEERVNNFAYVPFSAGPRNCIGQKFAMLEMKSTISKVLRHFELLPKGEPVRLYNSLILRSSTGVNLALKPRLY